MKEFNPYESGIPVFMVKSPSFINQCLEKVKEPKKYARSIRTETNDFADSIKHLKGEENATKNKSQ